MLAKLHTFSLLGIDALPVEVEVDVSPGGLPKTVLVGLARGGGQGEHASRRAGDGQLGLPAAAGPHRHQPGPGRPAQGGRLVRSADRAGHPGRQRADRLRAVRAATPWSASWPWTARTRPDQGRAVDGHGRGRAGRAARAGRAQRPARPRRPWSKASRSSPSPAWPRPWPSSPARSRSSPRRRGSTNWFREFSAYDVDFADVRGQEMAKRAVTVAAAGGHNILMLGPPGSGKTMLAKRVPTILPDLTPGESIETTRIYSAVGRLKPGQPLLATRPFRSPHHTISDAGLVGGGSTPAPGEIQLGAQRRAVPRRAARVQPPHARSAAPAAGRRHGDDLAGPEQHDVSGQLHADRGAEPLPVRLSRRSAARLPLHACRRSSGTCRRSAARCWTASTSTSRCRPCRFASCRPQRRARRAQQMREQVVAARKIQAAAVRRQPRRGTTPT